MSTSGQSPTVKRTRYTPQATDPVNPIEGDFFYSDGSSRPAAGPYVYQSGAWQQVSTSGSLATVDHITFTPQATDPVSPSTGMVFYSNGTPRAVGLWLYNGAGWVQLSGLRYQEFYFKDYVNVRVATTANLTLISQVENGDTIDGVVLVTGDLVLVKNQNTTSENGVYVVQVSGAPVRDTSADTADKLNNFVAAVRSGTANGNTAWFQTITLSTFSGQVWSQTPATKSFVVPEDATELHILATGGAGGGAGGTGSASASIGISGGGAAGAVIFEGTVKAVAASTLTLTLGLGGKGGQGTGATGVPGTNGTAGSATTITGTGLSLKVPGSAPGKGTGAGAGFAGGPYTAFPDNGGGATATWQGGQGGNTVTNNSGFNAGPSFYVPTGAAGGNSVSGTSGGGAGGSSLSLGAAGGFSVVNNHQADGLHAGNTTGGGGSGGTGSNNVSAQTGIGGRGSCGYVRISWR